MSIDELDQLHAAATAGPKRMVFAVRAYNAWPGISARLRAAEAEVARLRAVLRNVRDNYDCDEDAHRYGTICRCCDARAALGGP